MSINVGVSRTQHIHAMGYYASGKWNRVLGAATCMNIESIILSGKNSVTKHIAGFL